MTASATANSAQSTATRPRPFQQIDVFGSASGDGNPLAVVLDGSGLTDAQMQRFAGWTQLSETTFLLPPTDGTSDYRVRIFTPGGELPFAGHPTLGSCHAWLAAGGRPRDAAGGTVVQQCAIGAVRLRREVPAADAGTERLWFAAPPLTRHDVDPALLASVCAALGLQPHQVLASQQLDNGPVWLGLLLDSAHAVLSLEPHYAQLKGLMTNVGVAHVEPGQAAIQSIAPAGAEDEAPTVVVRAFAPPIGIDEDPVTGSLHASLGQWLIADGWAPPRYVAAQGERLGRAGRVHVLREGSGTDAALWVGGACVTRIQGSVTL